MEVAPCRCPQISCFEDFQNSYRNYEMESIFSKIEDVTSAVFLKMNSATDIYSESFKTF